MKAVIKEEKTEGRMMTSRTKNLDSRWSKIFGRVIQFYREGRLGKAKKSSEELQE